jgi:deoxyribose-phosphate aldolase
MNFDIKRISRYIDHTLLKPEADSKAIEKLCAEAVQHNFYSVCVNSIWAGYCNELLQGTSVKIAVVSGFPLGANHSAVKAFEAAVSAANGATEIDMVLAVGLLLEGRYDDVRADIAQVVEAVRGGAIIKVILETGLLSDEQKRIACQLSAEAGAQFVKTSTGFGHGGATLADVKLMREAVPMTIGVKASGGIRDAETAIAMIEAGADRLGTSSGIAIVQGSAGTDSY